MVSSKSAMPKIPPSAAVESDHWFTGMRKSLKITTQIRTSKSSTASLQQSLLLCRRMRHGSFFQARICGGANPLFRLRLLAEHHLSRKRPNGVPGDMHRPDPKEWPQHVQGE